MMMVTRILFSPLRWVTTWLKSVSICISWNFKCVRVCYFVWLHDHRLFFLHVISTIIFLLDLRKYRNCHNRYSVFQVNVINGFQNQSFFSTSIKILIKVEFWEEKMQKNLFLNFFQSQISEIFSFGNSHNEIQS